MVADVAGADPVVEDPLAPASEPDDVAGVPEPWAVSLLPEPPVGPASGFVPSAVGDVDALERLASRASFLAQPEPLNTMAGVDSARFSTPPQRSHVVGPGAEMPWMTSST